MVLESSIWVDLCTRGEIAWQRSETTRFGTAPSPQHVEVFCTSKLVGWCGVVFQWWTDALASLLSLCLVERPDFRVRIIAISSTTAYPHALAQLTPDWLWWLMLAFYFEIPTQFVCSYSECVAHKTCVLGLQRTSILLVHNFKHTTITWSMAAAAQEVLGDPTLFAIDMRKVINDSEMRYSSVWY